MRTTYPLARSLRLRLAGSAVVVAGFIAVLAAVAVGVAKAPDVVLTVGIVGAVLVVLGTNLWLALLKPVLELDDQGYRIRYLRGAGDKSARWLDVTDVGTSTARGLDVLVFNLRSGRTSRLPVAAVQSDPDQLVRIVQDHVQRGHGYRPVSSGG